MRTFQVVFALIAVAATATATPTPKELTRTPRAKLHGLIVNKKPKEETLEIPDEFSIEIDDVVATQYETYANIKCDQKTCNAKTKCQCPSSKSGSLIPLSQIPQFVTMTFDDAVTEMTYNLINDGFRSEDFMIEQVATKCPPRFTLFVSHEYTSYPHVNKAMYDGHEIGSHTVTHHNNDNQFPQIDDKGYWEWELDNNKRQLSAFARVFMEDIKGFRSPFLMGGGDVMTKALEDNDYRYDSTLINQEPIWPFSMNYTLGTCNLPPCPALKSPLTQVPLIWITGTDGKPCAMIDDCEWGSDPKVMAKALADNFKRFQKKRIPFPLFLHAPFIHNPIHMAGLKLFMRQAMKNPANHFVTVSQVLDWMENPVPLSDYLRREEGRCESVNNLRQRFSRESICHEPFQCKYNKGTYEEIVEICGPKGIKEEDAHLICPPNSPSDSESKRVEEDPLDVVYEFPKNIRRKKKAGRKSDRKSSKATSGRRAGKKDIRN